MRLFLYTITIAFFSAITYAQPCALPIIANGECDPPSLTFPTTVTWVANPNSAGINTTVNVGKYSDDGNNGWDNILLDYGTSIDLATNHFLHMDIYTPAKDAQVMAKLEGGTSTASEAWSPFSGSTSDWVHFVWDFSSQSAENHNKIVLFFDASKEDGVNPTYYYFDNLQWTNSATLSDDQLTKPIRISIFPNPADTAFKVESLDVVTSYSLRDITGRTLMNRDDVGATSFSVDISHLEHGVYLLDVNTPTASKSMKLVKK